MRKHVRRLLFAFGLVLALGHGATEPGSGCSSNGCAHHAGGVCEGFTQLELAYTSTGTCAPGLLLLLVDAQCAATLTLPDGSTVSGTYANGVSTFETAWGACALDRYALSLVCAGDGSTGCSSTLAAQSIADAGVDASMDASVAP